MKGTIAWLASLFTIVGISISNAVEFWQTSSEVRKFLLIIVLVGALVMALVDVVFWFRSKPKRYKSEAAINQYMISLFQRGGSASIFANNLSWVTTEVLSCVGKLARDRKKVIKVYVPKQNSVTEQLQKVGVQVKTYPGLNYVPEARFTLVNPTEPGSSILAIGKGTLPNFYIDEYYDQTQARIISMARDLFNILEKIGATNARG